MASDQDVPNNSRINITYNRDLPGPFREMNLASFIKSPREMGMSGQTNGWGIDTIGKNMGGLMSYIQLLVTGTSKASKVAAIDYPISGLRRHQPLGHAYFFDTGFKCTDRNGNLQNALAHINTVPLGNLPIVSAIIGGNLQEMRGLLPSIFESVGGLNPMILLNSLDISNGEPCNRDVENNANFRLPIFNITKDGNSFIRNKPPVQFSNAYMFNSSVRKVDPCLFRGPVRNSGTRIRRAGTRTNPVTGERCKERFSNINDDKFEDDINLNSDNFVSQLDKYLDMLNIQTKNDWLIQLYYISFSILIIFIIIKIINKHNTKM